MIDAVHEASSGGAAGGEGSLLWLIVPCLPLVAAVLQFLVFGRFRRANASPGRLLGVSTSVVCAAVFLGLASMWVGGTPQGTVNLPGLVGFGLSFQIGPMGLMFALFTTAIWAVAAFFSVSYLAKGHAHGRYYFYFLLSLGGTAGVFFAGDLLTLFVFFELVSLGSFPLVIHEETEEAASAGRLYLYMGIAGGLALLLGAMWLQALQGSAVAVGLPMAVSGPRWPWIAGMALLILGFGVKAGMYPVHVWLPRAHPVAPAPASALLSGVMIKTGAYGIYQVVRMFSGDPLGGTLGAVLATFALLTMFLGAVLALVQTNAKRLLAYSSVSQMGYILLGVGAAGVLGGDEAMGAAGFALHVLNHALFKSTLFMLVGVVYLRTHELDLRRLGGLWRSMPVTAAVFAIAGMSIAGMPGLCGYASKTLLHDAILILRHDDPGHVWRLVELLFTLGGAMTFAYATKAWYFLFLRRPRDAAAGVDRRPPGGETGTDRIIAVALAVPMLFIGLRPAATVSALVAPFAASSGFGHAALHHVKHVLFFSQEALQGAGASLGLGVLVFAALYVTGFPNPEFRRGPSVEGWVFRPLIGLGSRFCLLSTAFDRLLDLGYLWLTRACLAVVCWITWLDLAVERSAIWFGAAAGRTWVIAADTWYAAWRRMTGAVAGSAKRAAELLPVLDYAPGESETAREFSVLNLDFDFLVVLAVIAFTLALIFFTMHA